MQERHNSNTNALEVRLSCTKPPICCINECLSGYKAFAGSVMIHHLANIMIGKEHNFWLIHVHQSSVNDFNIQRDMVFNKCGLQIINDWILMYSACVVFQFITLPSY